jgi:hypothetical protein
MDLPKELITTANTPDLQLMTHLYEKMTSFPPEELVVLWEKYFVSPGKVAEENSAQTVYGHKCLIFPFVGKFAQAYDCVSNIALHIRKYRGDKHKVIPVYTPRREFRVIAPFILTTTLAITKNENRPVIIDMSGEIILEDVPPPMLKGLLH